jgi:hypothetical protein
MNSLKIKSGQRHPVKTNDYNRHTVIQEACHLMNEPIVFYFFPLNLKGYSFPEQ